VVSHAGTVLLAELADRIGLTAALSEVTDGLRERRGGHDPRRVLVDVAVAIADGGVTISDVQTLANQQGLHGPASARQPQRPAAMTALEVRQAGTGACAVRATEPVPVARAARSRPAPSTSSGARHANDRRQL